MTSTPPEHYLDITTYLTHQERIRKMSETKKNCGLSRRSSNYHPRAENTPSAEREPQRMTTATTPPLRRKSKFSNILRGKLDSPTPPENLEKTIESSIQILSNPHGLRSAILEGKLERFVPPTNHTAVRQRHAPPRPIYDVFTSLSLSETGHRMVKSISAHRNIPRANAGLVEKTRKELADQFKPPFENLSYLQVTGKNESGRFSFDFEEEWDNRKVSSSEAKNEEALRRLSGDGVDPWGQGGLGICRLCCKPGVASLGGLCVPCRKTLGKSEFLTSGTSNQETLVGSYGFSDNEIKPTPPLKDKKHLSLKPKALGNADLNKKLPPQPKKEHIAIKGPRREIPCQKHTIMKSTVDIIAKMTKRP